jgi:hypothetical protein
LRSFLLTTPVKRLTGIRTSPTSLNFSASNETFALHRREALLADAGERPERSVFEAGTY